MPSLFNQSRKGSRAVPEDTEIRCHPRWSRGGIGRFGSATSVSTFHTNRLSGCEVGVVKTATSTFDRKWVDRANDAE